MAPTRSASESGATRRSRRIASQEPESIAPLPKTDKSTHCKRDKSVEFDAPVMYERIVQHYRTVSPLSPGRIVKTTAAHNRHKPSQIATYPTFKQIMKDYPNRKMHFQRLTKPQLAELIEEAAENHVQHERETVTLNKENNSLRTENTSLDNEVYKLQNETSALNDANTELISELEDQRMQHEAFQKRYRLENLKQQNLTAMKPATSPQNTYPDHERTSSSPEPTSHSDAPLSTAVTSRISTPFQLGRSLLNKTLTGLVSPFMFGRKRGTDDEMEAPTAKRVRREEPTTGSRPKKPAQSAPSPNTPSRRPAPSVRPSTVPKAHTQPSRIHHEEPLASTPRPVLIPRSARLNYSTTPTPHVAPSSTPLAIDEPPTERSRKRRAPSEDEPDTESKLMATPKHRSQFLGPSTANRRVPTSLSVISERTERTATPATPTRRNIASVRKARAERQASLVPVRPPAYWERDSTYKPMEPNADARFQKLQRMRALQAELKALQNDPEVKEMTYEAPPTIERSTKRVKVDRLTVIPARRAGESSGTFRVPEIDSDDEISVEGDVTERLNIFEDAADAAPREVPDVVNHSDDPISLPSPPIQPRPQAETEATKWSFPSVGLRKGPPESDEYVEAARAKFAGGLAVWLAEHGM